MVSRFIDMLDVRWTYEGVDKSMNGNGGSECAEYLPTQQKIIESVVFISVGLAEILYAYPRVQLPKKVPEVELKGDRTGRRVMLLILTLVFGIEIGFKIASKQLIFALNPCHMITLMQVSYQGAP